MLDAWENCATYFFSQRFQFYFIQMIVKLYGCHETSLSAVEEERADPGGAALNISHIHVRIMRMN